MTRNRSGGSVGTFVRILNEDPLGWEYTESSKLGLDHFQFEEIDLFWWHKFASSTWLVPFFLTPIYFLAIFGLQSWLKDRKPVKMDGFLQIWNFFLAVFSIMGLFRTVPGFFNSVWSEEGGMFQSICERTHANGQIGFWTVMFCLSKFLQLGDTLFLVLRKKPLVLLHLVHHVFMMVATWNVAPYIEPVARWWMVLNFTEHAMMYPYFFLRSLNVKLPIIIPNIITTFQLFVMIAGFASHLLTICLYYSGYKCARDPFSIKICFLVTIAFLFLFGKQFFDYVILEGRQRKEDERKKHN